MKFLFFSLLLPSLSFAGTIIPFEREAPRVDKYSYVGSQHSTSGNYTIDFAGDADDKTYSQGFSVSNYGPNEIVPEQPFSMNRIERNFAFVTDDKSQRENYLWISDYNGSGYLSDYFETAIVFLPRLGQMHVEETEDTLLVTIPTGEEVIFSKKHKAIVGGVLSETPVDLNPSRAQRKFAGITYSGKGIMIRSDSRAADPRLGKNLEIIKPGLKPCQVSRDVFWTQEGFPKFKFINDEDAYAVIKEKCGADYLP